MIKKRDKKGLSPVIATVLLIAMVIVLALIIFLWFRGMTQEAITKFDGQNVELVCKDVSIDASYSEGRLFVSNNGPVPIFNLKIKMEEPGAHETTTYENWPDKGLNPGGSFSGDIELRSEINKITLIPVLLGKTEDAQRTYVCDEGDGISLNI